MLSAFLSFFIQGNIYLNLRNYFWLNFQDFLQFKVSLGKKFKEIFIYPEDVSLNVICQKNIWTEFVVWFEIGKKKKYLAIRKCFGPLKRSTETFLHAAFLQIFSTMYVGKRWTSWYHKHFAKISSICVSYEMIFCRNQKQSIRFHFQDTEIMYPGYVVLMFLFVTELTQYETCLRGIFEERHTHGTISNVTEIKVVI